VDQAPMAMVAGCMPCLPVTVVKGRLGRIESNMGIGRTKPGVQMVEGKTTESVSVAVQVPRQSNNSET